jgi:hypothetical protein
VYKPAHAARAWDVATCTECSSLCSTSSQAASPQFKFRFISPPCVHVHKDLEVGLDTYFRAVTQANVQLCWSTGTVDSYATNLAQHFQQLYTKACSAPQALRQLCTRWLNFSGTKRLLALKVTRCNTITPRVRVTSPGCYATMFSEAYNGVGCGTLA